MSHDGVEHGSHSATQPDDRDLVLIARNDALSRLSSRSEHWESGFKYAGKFSHDGRWHHSI
ncbi:hypothetical protein GCM10027027_04730 [Neomicrococcus lactis]